MSASLKGKERVRQDLQDFQIGFDLSMLLNYSRFQHANIALFLRLADC